jgi:dihydrofolate reductase
MKAHYHQVCLRRRRMQGVGGPDEDCSGGFEPGGWALPLFDSEAATFLNQVYERADAFLFGRRTYEIFAGYWEVMANPGINPSKRPQTRGLSTSHRPHSPEPRWPKTTILSGDVAAAVGQLKSKRGGSCSCTAAAV